MFRTLVLLLVCFAQTAFAQSSYRVATYNVGLGRDGPGLLLKDILSRDDDILALISIIADVSPDILLLTNFDGDYHNVAAQEFIALLKSETNTDYPFFFATEGNSGQPSGFDLNGNGYLDDWADNWGFGLFPGHENMLLLSKFPIDVARSSQMNTFKWVDLPNATAPQNPDGSRFLVDSAWENIRLASKDFWDIAVLLPNGQDLRILASHATPPVFDGEENMNGLRNDAEVGFWQYYLDQNPEIVAANFVITADFNADPMDGAGLKLAINTLLQDDRITDPQPRSEAAVLASLAQAGVNETQSGDPATDSADWADAEVGNLRVDYVLPSANQTVIDSGVYWPQSDNPSFALLEAAQTAHRLVWVDIALSP